MSNFKFHEPGESASKNADHAANAFLSDAFLAEGNTLDNVEAGLSQQVGGSAKDTQQRGAGAGGAKQSCAGCGKHFLQEEVFELDGKRYHEECAMVDKPCAECNRIILKPPFMRTPDGQFYHSLCWDAKKKYSSSTIQTVVAPLAKMTVEDPAADEERRRLAAKINEGKEVCPACHKVVTGFSVRFEERSYHTVCLVCSKCRNALVDRSFVTVEGAPVCSQCHIGAAKCVGCLKPLGAGAFVTAGKHTYHPDCFNCSMCKTNLRGKPYGDVKGYPRCADCVRK